MKTQQNATETTQSTPQTEQTATTPQPPETAAKASQSPSETPQSQSERRELTFEQKDFICKHIAAFKTYKEVASLFLEEFPDSCLTFEQVLKRIKYYACDNRTLKWRLRIHAYRDQLNHDLANRFPLANKYERLRRLEAMFHEALRPRLKRLFWYPLRRASDDKIIYRKVKVCEKDLAAAVRILSLFVKELDRESILPIYDPFMQKRSYAHAEEYDAELEAFRKQDPDATRDLDKTFAII